MNDPHRLHPGSEAFQAGGRTYTAAEVVAHAIDRGALQPAWREFVESEACVRAAEKARLEPDGDVLQQMSDDFRYDHDLITEEETEEWLAHRGSTLAQFHAYVLRRYWADALPEDGRPAVEAREFALEDLDGEFGVDLLLSGRFFRMTASLARRVAAGEPGNEPLEFKRLESSYREHCSRVLVQKDRARLLQAMRLPLTKLSVEIVELESLDAAREAALCVTEDGIPMPDLAKEERYPYHKTEFLLEEVDETLQRMFLGAADGSVLPPIGSDGRFQLCRLIRKTEPDLSDESIAERIDARILDNHFADLLRSTVRWMIPEEAGA